MKNFLLLLLLLLSIRSLAGAQEDIIVIYANGPVFYGSTPSGANRKIFAGDKLPLKGVVRCSRGGMAKVLYDGKVHPLSEGHTYSLLELAEQQGVAAGGFVRRFWNFLMESVRNTDSNESLEQYHQRHMEEVSGSIRGYTRREHQLSAQPFPDGRIGREMLHFSWSSYASDSIYILRLLDDDGALLLSWRTRDTTLRIDAGQLALSPGRTYEWTVYAGQVAPDASHSSPYSFTYEPVQAEGILRQLEADTEYRQATAVEQALMRAQVLEESDYFNAARQTYEAALRDWPADRLVRRVYASFLARMGELPAGQQVLRTNG